MSPTTQVAVAWVIVGRLFAVVALVVAGCVVEPEMERSLGTTTITIESKADIAPDEVDVCTLAAALPADDPCSLVCDPAELAAWMVAEGAVGGRCYQLYCVLTDEIRVSAGVCLL